MLLIDLEVVSKATSSFFDVCARLVKGQWETIEGNHHIHGFVALLVGGLETLRTMEQKRLF